MGYIYKDSISDDFKYKRIRDHGDSSSLPDPDEDYSFALLDIESQLQSAPLTRMVPETREPEINDESDRLPGEVRDALNFDFQ